MLRVGLLCVAMFFLSGCDLFKKISGAKNGAAAAPATQGANGNGSVQDGGGQ